MKKKTSQMFDESLKKTFEEATTPPLKCLCAKDDKYSVKHWGKICRKCHLPIQPTTEPKTTSTGGEMVYVEAPPFHEPASAVSQSVVEGEWEKPIYEKWKKEHMDVTHIHGVFKSMNEATHGLSGTAPEWWVRNYVDTRLLPYITTLLHDERERIVKMCEEMKESGEENDKSPYHQPQPRAYNKALSDLRDKLSTP